MSTLRIVREGSASLARLNALSVTFPGRATPAVDRVSLEIGAGECVALVGESGSGKSLTARALLGLLPESAIVRGEILLASPGLALVPAPTPVSAAWNSIRGARAGLIPQDALGALDPLRRIEHEVGDSLRLHRLCPRANRRERVVAALASAGMPDPRRRLRQRSDELSGGLRQRALIASALIADPTLIVADEPTTALDAGHRARVLAEFRRRVDAGAGALLISHDLESVRDIADRVFVMRAGAVVDSGDTGRVLADPSHPFTRELIAASPGGKPRGERLLVSTAPRGERLLINAVPRGERLPVSESPARLEVRGLALAFGRGAERHEVLDGASLKVHAGETVGLLGESGSGKTTLLRIALGLQAADAGEVLIDGVQRSDADRRTRRELRRRIAFVPQDPLDSFPAGVTGTALLTDALRAARVRRSERSARAFELASEVGLAPADLTRPAATLSGGQRQRLAIARALARTPEILLLDEPVSALDVTVQARVLDLLDDLQARHGTAYLFVSHDEAVIRHMSDRVLRLRDGRIEGDEAGSLGRFGI